MENGNQNGNADFVMADEMMDIDRVLNRRDSIFTAHELRQKQEAYYEAARPVFKTMMLLMLVHSTPRMVIPINATLEQLTLTTPQTQWDGPDAEAAYQRCEQILADLRHMYFGS